MISRLLRVCGAGVLVVGLTAGGALLIRDTVERADRSAPTELGVKGLPDGYQEDPDEKLLANGLTGENGARLLPREDRLLRGADIGEHGPETELSGPEATALLKDRAAHWPDEARRTWEDGLDAMELRGMAMRSYQHRGQDSAIEIVLTEFSSAGDAESRHRATVSVADLMGELFSFSSELDAEWERERAMCFLEPREEDLWEEFGVEWEDDIDDEWQGSVDHVHCSAVVGRHHVSMSVAGASPLKHSFVTDLFDSQITHIETPGMTV